jgi:hypothetical protein
MNRRRLPQIFTDLTDPGVPLLFLFGTLVLAVLGNAVYDLLVELISVEPDRDQQLRLALLSLGSLTVLCIVVGILWVWYNARRRRQPPPLPDDVKLESTYPGLVIFVSSNPKASERAAIYHHLQGGSLQKLWLIVSQEAREKAQKLTTWLRQEQGGEGVQLTQLALDDAFDVAAAYRSVIDAFETADVLLDKLIVDITAGTKQMSAGAVIACREYGVPMQYIRGEYQDGQVQPNAPSQLMKVLL